ncbi:toll/interleukin-1 receptor domain-containing protein [Actinoplanes teichomyceticus]|uniref:TIR domain-containing protein n=1 Tax=Actinoplanes teichomyceticus TaxID=1867 RepID=A0A561WII0_ACTTI|nr:toll/interleukin-1 receptor domain-containing protein [Actinoplanes teichomyceticus]TWG23682.1 TIR domain-containing protein [Actinoplanes teichomyceticus]GIF11723.1 hypothetical protein Ate01nite_17550 [Actinoplanes teichomyceticus]
MPILLCYAPADARWAQWISESLQAAGHPVEMLAARADFAHRIAAALSGPDRVIVLLSAEHPASASDWARVPAGPDLLVFSLDRARPPAALRAATCRSLHDLDEEEALEVLMAAVGGPQNPSSRTP